MVVCSHPYDATFALGGVIGAFADAGASIRLLCFTHSRHADPDPGHRIIKANELGDAARVLGISEVTLLDYQPGRLGIIRVEELTAQVVEASAGADALLVVGSSWTTTMDSDHAQIERAAIRAATRLGDPLFAWTPGSADQEHGCDILAVPVDRRRQQDAAACHLALPSDDPLRTRWERLRNEHEDLVVLCAESTPSAGGRRRRRHPASPRCRTGG